jgi:hypothetical protein
MHVRIAILVACKVITKVISALHAWGWRNNYLTLRITFLLDKLVFA